MIRALLVVLTLAIAALLFTFLSGRSRAEGPAPIVVRRGSVVRKAVAVGQVEPEHESHVAG